ncbi:hypothetical protein [Sorangium sp. So ce204]|uniref:hypothetical protein n=1 Tax=Sorangium sp. So ce204 TaxID=3133288 RepID=UPI003F60A581
MSQAEGRSASGKYLLLEVPNWSDAANESEQMSTYLRLGAVKDPSIAASPLAPRASGEDLAARVTTFIDDERARDGCPDFIPVADRKAETAKLHTKGGWRDHSDGNRITTTRGDKVEVIQGNYRMLVLGRQEHDSGWDVSGGHVSEAGITFEGSSEIRWVQSYDGTWRVIEESVKGDVITTFHGDTRDTYYGRLKESTTGSESPANLKENPRILDRTWAEEIASYTGSAARPVPSISDETWADRITSKTTAATMSDTTTCSGAITSSTTAGTITDTTTAGMMTSTTVCPIILDTTVGDTVSTIVGSEVEIVTGQTGELTIGGEDSITIGTVMDITLALMLDVCVAGKLEVSLGAAVKFNAEAEFDITPKAVKQCVSKVETLVTNAAVAATHSFF